MGESAFNRRALMFYRLEEPFETKKLNEQANFTKVKPNYKRYDDGLFTWMFTQYPNYYHGSNT